MEESCQVHVPTEDLASGTVVCDACGLVLDPICEFVQASDAGYLESIALKDQASIDPFAHKGVSQFMGRKPCLKKGSRRSITVGQILKASGVLQESALTSKTEKSAQKSRTQSANMLARALGRAQLPKKYAMMVRSMFWSYQERAPSHDLKRRLIKDPLVLAQLCCLIVAEDARLTSEPLQVIAREVGWKQGRSQLPKGLFGKVAGVREVVRAPKSENFAGELRFADIIGVVDVLVRKLEKELGMPKTFSSSAYSWSQLHVAFLFGGAENYAPPSEDAVREFISSPCAETLSVLTKWLIALASWFNLVDGRSTAGLAGAALMWALRIVNFVKYDPMKRHLINSRQAFELITKGEDFGGNALRRRLGEFLLLLKKVASVLLDDGESNVSANFASYGGNWLATAVRLALGTRPEILFEKLWRSYVDQETVSVRSPPCRHLADQFSQAVAEFCGSDGALLHSNSDTRELSKGVKEALSKLLRAGYSPKALICSSASTILKAASNCDSDGHEGEDLVEYLNTPDEVKFKEHLQALKECDYSKGHNEA